MLMLLDDPSPLLSLDEMDRAITLLPGAPTTWCLTRW